MAIWDGGVTPSCLGREGHVTGGSHVDWFHLSLCLTEYTSWSDLLFLHPPSNLILDTSLQCSFSQTHVYFVLFPTKTACFFLMLFTWSQSWPVLPWSINLDLASYQSEDVTAYQSVPHSSLPDLMDVTYFCCDKQKLTNSSSPLVRAFSASTCRNDPWLTLSTCLCANIMLHRRKLI